MPRCPGCGGPGGVELLTSVAQCNRCEVRERDMERRVIGTTVVSPATESTDPRVIKSHGSGLWMWNDQSYMVLVEEVTHLVIGERGWWIRMSRDLLPGELSRFLDVLESHGKDNLPGWDVPNNNDVVDPKIVERERATGYAPVRLTVV